MTIPVWKDRKVERPNTYNIQNNIDGTITLIPEAGTIYEPGTPLNAANLNALGSQLEDIPKQSYITDKATKSEVEVERKRIDNFTKLSEGSTTGDAELIDGRIGIDGNIYNNIGEAIRRQLNTLNEDIDNISDTSHQLLLDINKSTGYYDIINGELKTYSSGNNYKYTPIKVKSGKTYSLYKLYTPFVVYYDGTSYTKVNTNSITHFSMIFTPPKDGLLYVTVSQYWIGTAMVTDYIGIPTSVIEGVIKNKINNLYLPNKSISIENTDFITSNKQLLKVNNSIKGKYYNRTDDQLSNNIDYNYFKPISIKKGVTYNYQNINHYYSMYYDFVNATWSPLNNTDSTLTGTSGSFTPENDGLVFITVHNNYLGKTAMFCDDDIPSNYIEGDYNILFNNTNIKSEYVVDINSTGDFTSLRTCLETIKPSKNNPVTVKIKKGTYDIRSYYSDDEWNSNLFYGLLIPDYTTLIGVGNREEVIITASSTDLKELISTLNLKNTSSMENLTVVANNIRYAVHDDWADNNENGYKRNVKNCVFKGTNLKYYVTYGAGAKQGADIIFEDCLFINDHYHGYSCHNNVGWAIPSIIKMINCRFQADSNPILFGTLNTNGAGGNMTVKLVGNKIDANQKVLLYEQDANNYGTGIKVKVTGYANNFDNTAIQITNTDGIDYSSNIDLVK